MNMYDTSPSCVQADIVRQLKASKADKAKVNAEVEILLSLKKQLGLLKADKSAK